MTRKEKNMKKISYNQQPDLISNVKSETFNIRHNILQ